MVRLFNVLIMKLRVVFFSLKAKIQSLKKAASKGDKKKKKEVAEEIAKLEADLELKHDQEVADLKNNCDSTRKSDSNKVNFCNFCRDQFN